MFPVDLLLRCPFGDLRFVLLPTAQFVGWLLPVTLFPPFPCCSRCLRFPVTDPWRCGCYSYDLPFTRCYLRCRFFDLFVRPHTTVLRSPRCVVTFITFTTFVRSHLIYGQRWLSTMDSPDLPVGFTDLNVTLPFTMWLRLQHTLRVYRFVG